MTKLSPQSSVGMAIYHFKYSLISAQNILKINLKKGRFDPQPFC